jgi:hypothetical protein
MLRFVLALALAHTLHGFDRAHTELMSSIHDADKLVGPDDDEMREALLRIWTAAEQLAGVDEAIHPRRSGRSARRAKGQGQPRGWLSRVFR